MMEQPGIDVVVRLYDTSELPLLARCVLALVGQVVPGLATSLGPIEPLRLHVMLQRFSVAEVQATRATVRTSLLSHEAFSASLHNWAYPEPFELSVPLLNWGLEVARLRYFTCLDIVELPLPGAFARLLARLRATRASVALGGMGIQPACWWGDVVLPLPSSRRHPARDAGSPLFLLDRTRVAARDVVFHADQPNAEIADFIARVGGNGAADTSCLDERLALRQMFEGAGEA